MEASGDLYLDRYEGWALWSGTSFSAPIVAAALAVDLQRQKAVIDAAKAAAGAANTPSTPPDDDVPTEVSTRLSVRRVIDHPRLHRLPCYGTVVNPAPTVAWL